MPLPNDLNPSTASWVPNPSRIESSGMAKFCLAAEQRWGRSFDSYDALHKWSIEHLDEFWMSVWDFCDVVAERRGDKVSVDDGSMESVRWFPDARLNFAQNVLKFRGDKDALV